MNPYIYYVFVLKNLFQNLFGTHYPTEIIRLIILRLYKPIQIVAGSNHTILISNKTYVWGRNYNGQLGLGDDIHRNSPQELPPCEPGSGRPDIRHRAGCSRISSVLEPFRTESEMVSASSLGLCPEKIHPNFNKVGDELPLYDIKSISCGANHTIALIEDDHIYVWGSNYSGQLGLGDNFDRLSPSIMEFRSKKSNGTSRIKSVVCGGHYTIVLTFSSKIYVWGSNRYGQLGLGDAVNRNEPRELILDHVESVCCGAYHTIALTYHNTLYVWGDNYMGQLGLGDCNNRLLPQKLKLKLDIPLSNIKSISCGGYYTIVLTQSNLLYSWGCNSHGQLGLGDKNHRNIPHEIALSGIKSVNCGWDHAIAVTTSDLLYVWGENSYGQLGLGDTNDQTLPQELTLSGVNAIVCSENHTIAIKNIDDVYVWGENGYGQLGLGDCEDRHTPCKLNFKF